MKKLLLTLIAIFAITNIFAQVNLSKWNIPHGNYSGITPIGDDRYAVVSDKGSKDGWYEFRIQQHERTGEIENVELIAFHNNEESARDAEGIVYVPKTNTLFISAEDDQRIKEYYLNGNLTGRELAIPAELGKDKIYSNYGFEALTYNAKTGLFWTCTENSLKADGKMTTAEKPVRATIRLQSFDESLQPREQIIYKTDTPAAKGDSRNFAFGVPALLALDDGSLLVMEREFMVTKRYRDSYVINKVYQLMPGKEKTKMTQWKTSIDFTHLNLANYEGMCFGRTLTDGSMTILFISDSQGGAGNSLYKMKDYIKVIKINPAK